MLAKDAFFASLGRLALTYDDVRLKSGVGGASRTQPSEVVLKTRFSRNVPMNIPIVAAAMEITEAEMAIGMAIAGGLGIIHRNLDPEKQAKAVATVKFYVNGLIEKPICVRTTDTIEAILRMLDEKPYKFTSLLVINRNERLVGMLTQRDFDFCDDPSSVTARDIMTKKVITAPQGTDFDTAYALMKERRTKLLPMVDDKKRVVGLYTHHDLKAIKTGRSERSNVDARGQLRVGAAVGTGEEAMLRAKLLAEKRVDVLVVDTAHGDTKSVIETLEHLKAEYPTLDVVAGNVSEPWSAQRLIDAGADGIKVGQGPGSICTTRDVTGIGCPQVTAVYNCARIAAEAGVPVIADGGLRFAGDIAIALGAGAESVMMGKMLAGADESPGDIVHYQGRRWKPYRGMGSLGAMLQNKGSRERYKQDGVDAKNLIPEGVEGLVPYDGPLASVLHQYLGALRQSLGYYHGVSTLEQFRAVADFHQITAAGRAESHPHDIVITRDVPNYKGGA